MKTFIGIIKTGNFKFYLDDKTFIPTQTTSAITEA